MEEKEKRKYEISFYVKEEGDTSVVSAVLEKAGAVNLKEEPVKKIQLAYPIKKEKIVFAKTIFFEIEGEKVNNIRNSLLLENKVLRFMITKVPEVLYKTKEERKNKITSDKAKSLQSEKIFSPKPSDILTNESLEKKIEEILS